MTQFMNSSELSQPTEPHSFARSTPGNSLGGVSGQYAFAPSTSEIPTGGTTGQIAKVITERRSGRRQWRLFEICLTVVVDALLVYAAFKFAYYLRYNILLNSDWIANIRVNVLGRRPPL